MAESRADKAYRHIKTQILAARLRPGASLNEEQLGRVLRISRTPVREAISRLEQEGLVTRYPNRGAMVSLLSLTEMLELWEVREILEVAACRLAALRGEHEGLAPIHKGLAELARYTREPTLEHYERHHELDLALHRAVFQATRNESLTHLYETVSQRIRRARMISSPTRFHNSVREHLAIIAAITSGDQEVAARAMSEHLGHARETLYSQTRRGASR
jgi:DNA-binding GntR family transcriptional regulator